MTLAPSDIFAMLARAAAILREEGATEVYVFGSFARGDPHPDSDLDLAVTGLASDQLLAALERFVGEMGQVPDVIQMEREPAFVAYPRSKGELRRVA